MPERIIISRTDSIGDVLLTLPMAGELKKHFPDAKVIFLGRNYTRDIVALSKYIDEFISWDDQEKMDKRARLDWLMSVNADTILHVFPKVEIARLASKAKIKNRIGSTGRIYHYQFCNKLVPLSRKKSDLHESQLNFMLLKPLIKNLEIPALDKMYGLSGIVPPAKVVQKVKDLIDPNRFNLILHPKSKGSARDWPIERYGELIRMLPPDKYKIFVSGTKEEGELLGGFLREYADLIHNVTGAFTLEEFIQFISRADGLVAASTGPLHIAAGLNKLAIGIYPPIRPMHPGRWSPLGQHAEYLVMDKSCNDCRNSGACHCMKEITANQVLKRIVEYDRK